ncbi:M23 family metallopeptidase [Agromyces sp. NPDC058484]|uniref:M23 family metallopeptidase n=1 Tax=Agromyces sp. NPDC058484 TaxID=3346524 RepID=UPI0036534C30
MAGRLMARNSPARRVPSHGTHLMGTTYAIDLIPVDERGRSAPWNWRALVGVEPAARFVGFGAPVFAPCAGRVVIVHDGEADHEARRSQLTLIPYMARQPDRIRAGAAGVAGNHVVIAIDPVGPFVLLAHLRRGSIRVRPDDRIEVGAEVAACGNSGNSTQPHLHLQATDSTDWNTARGLPIAFRTARGLELPRESEIVTVR